MSRALVLAVLASTLATSAAGVDVPEPGSAEAIAAATTEPRFLSSWVSSVPDDPKVPSPTDYLGFDFDPIHRYLTVSDFRLVWNALLHWNDLPAPQ